MRTSAASAPGSPLSCVIASTPSTGSTVLCRGLAQTGIVGQPDEYIAIAVYNRFAAQWGYPPAYEPATTRVARAMEQTATPNGVFAVHAYWYDFALLLRTIRNAAEPTDWLDHVDRLLVTPRYVHISRRDTGAQALSLDGQPGLDLRDGDRVRCRRSEHHVNLFRIGTDFFHVLRTKLKWGEGQN